MRYQFRRARVNIKVLVIVIAAPIIVIGGLLAARHIRRGMRQEQCLALGLTAFENQEWEEACKNFREYLGHRPDDFDVLKKYAEALWSFRPLDTRVIAGLISAYSQIMEHEVLDEKAFERLAALYGVTRQFDELAQTAEKRLARVANDRSAPLWQADALLSLNKPDEVRKVLTAFIERLEGIPERHVEYVRACVRMSTVVARNAALAEEVITENGKSSQMIAPREWLDKAVEYMPDSAEALAYRARFLRQAAQDPNASDNERSALLLRAREDLTAAATAETDDPRVRLLLAAELVVHREFDRAAAELAAADELPGDRFEEYFFDFDDWIVARFPIAREVATQRGDATAVVSLADGTLKSLSQARHRIQILPAAVRIYASARQTAEARRYLDEYVELLREGGGQAESPMQLAVLQGLVASLEDRPDVVVDTLEPVLGDDPENPALLRLMADAYARTGKTGQAIDALNRYLATNPDDPQATYELARQYSRSGQWARASDCADRAELLGVTGVGVRLLAIGSAARLAIGQTGGSDTERLKELARELAVLKEADPNEVNIRVFQALIAGHLGQPEEAERHLKLAAEECENALRARSQLAAHYRQQGQMAEAIAACREACDRHPEVAAPWFQLADSHTVNEDHAAARDCLREGLDVVAEGQEKRTLSIKLALLELEHGDRAAGIGLLNELVTQNEEDISARVVLLSIPEIRQDQKATEKLISELKKAEGEDGRWWRLHQASSWLSSDAWRSKQTETSDLLEYCIDAVPGWPVPVVLLAGMYNRLGESAKVEEICRRGLQENPSATEIADILLGSLYRQKRFTEAQEVLARLRIGSHAADDWQIRIARGTGDILSAIERLRLRVADDAMDAAGRIELARLVYQETQDAEEAFGYLKQAEAIDPRRQTLVATKASILRSEGKPLEALQALDDYVADQNDFNAYWMRAAYLAEQGDVERAERDYAKLTTFAENGTAGYGLLSGFYAGIGKLDQAVATLEDGLKAYPDDMTLQRRLMLLLFRRNSATDQQRASEMLASLRGRLPGDVELITMEAMQTLAEPTEESLASARGVLEEAVKLAPRQVNAHRALIDVAMRQGEYQAACDYAIEALDANPNTPELVSARARAELAMGYIPTATRLAREVLRDDPNNTEAWRVLVDGALVSKDHTAIEQARTLIDSVVKRDPQNEFLLLSRARVLRKLEQPLAAIPELEAYCLTERGSGSLAAFVMVADLYRMAGEMEQAGGWIEKAEQLAPQSQSVVFARSLWLASQERYKELEGISSAYMAAQDQDLATIRRAASLLLSLDSSELKREAVELFYHAADIAPTSVPVSLDLAASLHHVGDMDRAKKVYRELLERQPDSMQALNNLAWILQEQDQRYEAALELADRGLRLYPDDLDLLDTRGTIRSKIPDQLAAAKSDFQRLAELSFGKPAREAKALLKLIRVCADLDDLPEAKKHAQRCLRLSEDESGVLTEAERQEIMEILQASDN